MNLSELSLFGEDTNFGKNRPVSETQLRQLDHVPKL